MKLSGDLTLEQMLEKLRSAAPPGEDFDLSLSSISRHAAGQLHPGPMLQDLYSKATDRAVQPQDWVELAKEIRLAKQGEQA